MLILAARWWLHFAEAAKSTSPAQGRSMVTLAMLTAAGALLGAAWTFARVRARAELDTATRDGDSRREP